MMIPPTQPFAFSAQPLPDSIAFEPIAQEKCLRGEPTARSQVLYESEDTRLCSGIWESTDGAWRVSYDECELCVLIEGNVILTSADGHKQQFAAPCSFMIPEGFSGTWESAGNVRKFFVIYAPGA